MNTHPPRLAWTLLQWLAMPEDALIGDLDEEFRRGRTSTWYWRQALSLIVLSPARQVRSDPLRSARGLALAWAAFLAVFAVFEVFIAPRLAGSTIGGYSGDGWSAFWIGACICSYVGFAVSAWIISFHRNHPGPVLMLHVASVVLAMAIAVAIVEIRAPAPTRVPHVLFPLVSVALPYQLRSGFILAPLTMVIVGLLVSRRRQPQTT